MRHPSRKRLPLTAFGHVWLRCATAGLSAVILAASLTACATPKPAEPAPTPKAESEFNLSPNAETVYNYLKFEELSRGRQPDGNPGEALRKVLESSPSPDLYIELANHYWRIGKLPQAREVLKEGQAKFPEAKSLYLNLATSYIIEKRYEAAILSLRDYQEKFPEDMMIRQDIAAIQIEDKKFAEAVATVKSVPENQRTATMRYYLAKAENGLGRTTQAVTILEKLVKDEPNHLEAWAELAFLYELGNDYAKAEKVYSRIMEMGESGPEVRLRLIRLNLKLNNPSRAYTLTEDMADNQAFILQAGLAFLRDGFPAQAEKLLNRLLTRGGSVSHEIYFQLSVIQYEHHRNPTKALEYLNKIPVSDSRYSQVLGFKGQILIQLKQLDAALAIAREGQERFSQAEDFWLIESGVLEERGEYEQARQVTEQALTRFPQSSDLLYHLGVIYERLNDRKSSFKIMEDILVIDPDHADALNYIGYTLAEEGRDLDRAEQLILKALKIKPGSGYILDSLAWVYYKANKAPQAWSEIQRAVLKISDDPTIWEHYADIAKALKRKTEARKGYRKALESGHKEPDKIREKMKSL